MLILSFWAGVQGAIVYSETVTSWGGGFGVERPLGESHALGGWSLVH